MIFWYMGGMCTSSSSRRFFFKGAPYIRRSFPYIKFCSGRLWGDDATSFTCFPLLIVMFLMVLIVPTLLGVLVGVIALLDHDIDLVRDVVTVLGFFSAAS